MTILKLIGVTAGGDDGSGKPAAPAEARSAGGDETRVRAAQVWEGEGGAVPPEAGA